MRLEWKGYGDRGRTARGINGDWRVVDVGECWELTTRPRPGLGEPHWWKRGEFETLADAQQHAQDYEDSVVQDGEIMSSRMAKS